jgi:hypothetical protein
MTVENIINGQLEKTKSDRSVLYDLYYNDENCPGFDFVSVLSTLCSIARPSKDGKNKQCFESYVAAIKKHLDDSGDTKGNIKPEFFENASNLQYWLPALDRVLSSDNKVRTSRFFGEGKGFQYRPTFQGKGNTDTNYVEFADENNGAVYDNLFIENAIICSQRFFLDLENGVLTKAEYAEKAKNDERIQHQKKEYLRNDILLNLPLLSEADSKTLEDSFNNKPYNEFLKDAENIVRTSDRIKNDLNIYSAEVKDGRVVVKSMVDHLTELGHIDVKIDAENKKAIYKDADGNEYSADLSPNGKLSNEVITKPKEAPKKPVEEPKTEVKIDDEKMKKIFNKTLEDNHFEGVIEDEVVMIYENSVYNNAPLTDEEIKQTKEFLKEGLVALTEKELINQGLSKDMISADVLNGIDDFINTSVDNLLTYLKSESAREKRLGDETEKHILDKYSGLINATLDQAFGNATLGEDFVKNIEKITETTADKILTTKLSEEDPRTLGAIITDEIIATSKNYQGDTNVLDDAIYDSVEAFVKTNLENRSLGGKIYQKILVNLQNAKTFNDVNALYEEAVRINKAEEFEEEIENKLKELC